MKLSQLKVGQRAKVVRVKSNPELSRKLRAMGLIKGAVLPKIVSFWEAPYGTFISAQRRTIAAAITVPAFFKKAPSFTDIDVQSIFKIGILQGGSSITNASALPLKKNLLRKTPTTAATTIPIMYIEKTTSA